MSGLRRIAEMKVPGIEPGPVGDDYPAVEDVDPKTLLVDEKYQRNLSERSVSLIRKIVAGWDWRAFKPPVVVRTGDGMHVLDGQHTAIAAASHPGVKTIPVMVVRADTQEERAGAFVKHNRDRIQATPTQLHFALVAAGDEQALTVQQVCDRAGARILKSPPGAGRFQPGDTMAVAGIGTLVNKRHAHGARRVVQICVDAKLAPIGAGTLKAVEELIFGDEYAGSLADGDLTTTLREMGAVADKEAAQFAALHDVPQWKALVAVLFKNTRKQRRGPAKAA